MIELSPEYCNNESNQIQPDLRNEGLDDLVACKIKFKIGATLSTLSKFEIRLLNEDLNWTSILFCNNFDDQPVDNMENASPAVNKQSACFEVCVS
ncbi:unnamed protein product [Ambrosiozyma monospora]|uniref:Unnamed protein product n=1 Tax=Ambrosiozyma monospora TaxID=43982 RepID=A0ACB5UAQ7_AMBMO|nr:unnamed protein product [Ambrosiozyma monospora]